MKKNIIKEDLGKFAHEHLCTISEFARICGVSRQTIYNFRKDDVHPDTIKKIIIGMDKIRSEYLEILKKVS